MRIPTSHLGEGNAGFSLLEIVLVLGLMALAAMVAIPSFSSGFESLQLRTSGRDLVSFLRQCRAEAVGTQKVLRVSFYAERDEPGVYVLRNEFDEEVRRVVLPSRIRFRTEDDQFPFQVRFLPTGRSSGGALVLEDGRGRSIEIVIDPITGFARVQPDPREN